MGFADNGIPRSRDHSARKAERTAVNAEVSLRRPGQNHYRVRAYDASPLGCKLEFVERPVLAERVWVKFEGLDALEGQVCWVNGFVVGVEFVRPMYSAVFDALIPRLR
jgi:hypothetical protein